MNKKGLICRKCNGTGVVESAFLEEVQNLINNEVKAFCTS